METDFAVAPVGETAPETTREAVLGIVREVLGRPALGLDDDMFDHGATSLSFVRVLAQINRDLHVMVAAASLGGVATSRTIAACIDRTQAGAAAGTKGA